MDSRGIEGKEGQVLAQIKRQEEALSVLSDTVSRLEKHLSAILLLQPNVKDVAEPEQELVPLAVKVRGNLRRIEEENTRLIDITARLEI